MVLPGLDDMSDNGGLFACVLSQHLAGHRVALGNVWHDLPPVILYELLGYQLCGYRQGCSGVVACLDGYVCQRQQQSILVGCHELSLTEQSLEVGEELDLLLGGGAQLGPSSTLPYQE